MTCKACGSSEHEAFLFGHHTWPTLIHVCPNNIIKGVTE